MNDDVQKYVYRALMIFVTGVVVWVGIMSGSRREDAESKGTDILGEGNWDSSLLYEFLSTSKAEVPGHDETTSIPVVFAGKPATVPTAIPKP